MRTRLKDKIAIVTGGATGIGAAISHQFGREGAAVVVNGLPGDPLEETVAALRKEGSAAIGVEGDVSRMESARDCIERTINEYGKIDILVNNAGVLPPSKELQERPVDEFCKVMSANVTTAYMMTHFALPYLQVTRGNILCTGSESGMNGKPGNVLYGAAKGWMNSFVRGLAIEQADYGIRVNCVCPGPIETRMLKEHEASSSADDIIPMGRRGTPEEVANVFTFLASEEASFITGLLFFVDGGESFAKGLPGRTVPEPIDRPPE